MEYVQSIILGIVQGIAEFLPISSSGHLVLGEELLEHFFKGSTLIGAGESNLILNIALHAGTLGSILVIYWKQVLAALREPRLLLAIVVATIPAAIVGLMFKDHLEAAFGSTLAVGCALCFTAGLLWMSQRVDRGEVELSQVSLKQAFLIGCCQVVALVPGVSRSGSTIVGGLWCGLQRETAATFSFLIAIPVIGGATLLAVKDLLEQDTTRSSQWASYAIGAVVAFGVGLFALKWLLGLISRRKLHHFTWYCLGVGLLTIGLSLASP